MPKGTITVSFDTLTSLLRQYALVPDFTVTGVWTGCQSIDVQIQGDAIEQGFRTEVIYVPEPLEPVADVRRPPEVFDVDKIIADAGGLTGTRHPPAWPTGEPLQGPQDNDHGETTEDTSSASIVDGAPAQTAVAEAAKAAEAAKPKSRGKKR